MYFPRPETFIAPSYRTVGLPIYVRSAFFASGGGSSSGTCRVTSVSPCSGMPKIIVSARVGTAAAAGFVAASFFSASRVGFASSFTPCCRDFCCVSCCSFNTVSTGI